MTHTQLLQLCLVNYLLYIKLNKEYASCIICHIYITCAICIICNIIWHTFNRWNSNNTTYDTYNVYVVNAIYDTYDNNVLSINCSFNLYIIECVTYVIIGRWSICTRCIICTHCVICISWWTKCIQWEHLCDNKKNNIQPWHIWHDWII